jgi:hypothetical protein
MTGFSVEFTENLGGTYSLLPAYPLSLWKLVYEALSYRETPAAVHTGWKDMYRTSREHSASHEACFYLRSSIWLGTERQTLCTNLEYHRKWKNNKQCLPILLHISKFVSVRFHCHYVIPGYHSNEIPSVNTLHEHTQCSRLQTTQKSFVPVYRVYSVRIYNILIWIREQQYTI